MVKTTNRLRSNVLDLRRTHPLIYSFLGALIVFIVFFAVTYGRLDPDFGWHLVTGKYILAHGVPRHDIYTYTARGFPWVDHEWGSDLILALLYKAGGYLLSAIFFAALWTIALLILGWGSRIWILYIAALAVTPYAGIRTLAWTSLFFALTIRILNGSNKRFLWVLPVIFLFWANVHAGFIAGLALIIYFAIMQKSTKLLALFLLCALVTLINPYGVRLYLEIAHTLFDPAIHNEINEWRSFFVNQPTIPYLALWVIGFLILVKNRWSKIIELGPLLLAAGLSASRNFPLLIVATVKDLDDYVINGSLKLKKLLGGLYTFTATTILVSLTVIVFYLSIGSVVLLKNRLASYPVKEVSYLRVHRCDGNLFNSYNYGGYLIWQLPKVPVYIDGRMVTWTKYMNQYESIEKDPAKNYPAQFKKYSITCALLTRTGNSMLINLLVHAGWNVAVSTNQSLLLTKSSNR